MKRIAIAATAAILAAGSVPALAHGPSGRTMEPPGAPEAGGDTPFGRAGDPADVARTMEVSMTDRMRFEPAEIRVKTGETVRIVASNHGAVLHEMVIGTMGELKEHAALMKKFPNMQHDEPNMAHVAPGGKEEIVWKFTKPGEFYFACLQPGHFEAGMVGKVIVAGTRDDARAVALAGAGDPPANAADPPELSQGVVRKVDKDAGKVTIRHGPLANLDMPAMTMVFRVKDPKMLDRLKVGEAIRFRAEEVAGDLTVTRVEPAR